MEGRWRVLVPSVLFLWMVCCNWAQPSVAASPYGANVTDLMRHVAFFDLNKDGIITLTESIKAFISIGCDPVTATTAATSTHAAFGPMTNPGSFIPTTDIRVSNIHRAVHASDTGAYDHKGNFVPEKFERIFQKYSRSEKDALSWFELKTMLIQNRQILNPVSWGEAEAEWELIHFLGKDRHGYLHKDTARGIYDGTVFPKLRDHQIDPHHSDA